MKEKFEGYYFKHQNRQNTLSLIPGRFANEAFIQVITEDRSWYLPFPINEYRDNGIIHIGDNHFAGNGIKVNIQHKDLKLQGELHYRHRIPVRGDIMGPFSFFPMECRHKLVSMRHNLEGEMRLNGQKLNFTGGLGYIEGDSGCSFPRGYSWSHCNQWEERQEHCSIVVSAAEIPFMTKKFWGCIAVIQHRGKQYRLATYKGAVIEELTENKIVIRQLKYRLEVHIPKAAGQTLYAPVKGQRDRTIIESAAVKARYIFSHGSKKIFDSWSNWASYEYAIDK